MTRIPQIVVIVALTAIYSRQAEGRSQLAVQTGQNTMAPGRAYELPSEITSLAESGDGTLIWVACQSRPSLEHMGKNTEGEIKKVQTVNSG